MVYHTMIIFLVPLILFSCEQYEVVLLHIELSIIHNKISDASVPFSLCICGQVIPFSRGSAWEQPPPDLASYLYKNRIVYLGMSLVPSVTELILAEFLYLQYEDVDKPIYLYINSTGTTKVNNFLYSL